MREEKEEEGKAEEANGSIDVNRPLPFASGTSLSLHLSHSLSPLSFFSLHVNVLTFAAVSFAEEELPLPPLSVAEAESLPLGVRSLWSREKAARYVDTELGVLQSHVMREDLFVIGRVVFAD